MKLIATLLFSITLSAYSFAAQLVVTNTNDAGAGSLRDQIALANPTDTIIFDASLNGQTIVLTSGNIAFGKSLTILGPGYNNLTISGNNNARIFDISEGDVVIRGLKIIDGFQSIGFPNEGGAIRQAPAGNLTLSNVYFDNNRAINNNGSQGGAVYYGVNNGTVMIDSCFFMNSQSDCYGAVSCNGSPYSVTIDHSWFDGNSVSINIGAFFTNAEILNVSNTTFSNNQADNRAGVELGSSFITSTFSNCTFSNNTVTGTPYREFGIDNGSLTLINCTFANNEEPVYLDFDEDPVNFTVQNCIFANQGPNFAFSGQHNLTSLGGNISSDTTMQAFLTATNDMNSTDPQLDVFANYGGLMSTHAIPLSSPARNNGITAGAPLLDQIGASRNGLVDAGSMEYICEPIADLTTTVAGTTITANATGVSYQWIDCANGNAAIAGETNQTFTVTANGNFAVVLTQNDCSDTSACVAFTTIGLNSLAQHPAISVSPNPTAGELTIGLNTDSEETTVIVRNTLGQAILSTSTTNSKQLELFIPGAAGIYFVEVQSADQTAQFQVVKK